MTQIKLLSPVSKRSACLGSEEARVPELLTQVAAMIERVDRKIDGVVERLAGATKDFYTVDEVAELTGRAAYTVRSWIGDGRIRAERVSGTGPRGRLLIPRAELKKLIASGRGARVPDIVAGS